MNPNEKLESEVARVGDLSRDELVERWVKAYRCPPPKGLKRGLLERAGAWQLQAKALGGPSAETNRLVRAVVRQFDLRLKRRSADLVSSDSATLTSRPAASPEPSARFPLSSGSRLLREWNGRQHYVEVVDKGFVFDGKTYRSLSAIARRITGAQWSGPRFFGL